MSLEQDALDHFGIPAGFRPSPENVRWLTRVYLESQITPDQTYVIDPETEFQVPLYATSSLDSLGVPNSTANPVTVHTFNVAASEVTGDANQPNLILTLSNEREDNGWSLSSNAWTYTGEPDFVRISAVTYFQQPNNTNYQRISPELQLLKNGSEVLAQSASGYQRHTGDHDSSSNTISFTDPNPGQNPTYSLRAQQGSSQTDILDIDLGSFQLEAAEVVLVTPATAAPSNPRHRIVIDDLDNVFSSLADAQSEGVFPLSVSFSTSGPSAESNSTSIAFDASWSSKADYYQEMATFVSSFTGMSSTANGNKISVDANTDITGWSLTYENSGGKEDVISFTVSGSNFTVDWVDENAGSTSVSSNRLESPTSGSLISYV